MIEYTIIMISEKDGEETYFFSEDIDKTLESFKRLVAVATKNTESDFIERTVGIKIMDVF